ncbi:Hypothetical predicted protein [Pelobates cultripes]|uniref:Uncharacterized protein n=1 Tax=Pelobates cultripes TaxID=61616 RepID=A0AAD1TFC4_PELCU|nr:Hypothetical predicted protein [Pelobates cultripes]
MAAGWQWGALSALLVFLWGVHGREECRNPLLRTQGLNPPRPSPCALRCATLTYYKILGSERRGSVLFTEASTSSEQYYCWFLSQRCRTEESLEMAFIMVDASPPPCHLSIGPNGFEQQELSPDTNNHELLSPLCGLRFEVTLPFQRAQNAAEFCVRHVCPQRSKDSSQTRSSNHCPPFLVTLWDKHAYETTEST